LDRCEISLHTIAKKGGIVNILNGREEGAGSVGERGDQRRQVVDGRWYMGKGKKRMRSAPFFLLIYRE
jgi:hypothetical protein